MLQISRDQARALGIIRPTAPKQKMNATEARFAALLNAWKNFGQVTWWTFEAVKLRLANRTWYTPDFFVIDKHGMVFYEVKGWWRDDARVKIKVAAEIYPIFRFEGVKLIKGGEWAFEIFR